MGDQIQFCHFQSSKGGCHMEPKNDRTSAEQTRRRSTDRVYRFQRPEVFLIADEMSFIPRADISILKQQNAPPPVICIKKG